MSFRLFDFRCVSCGHVFEKIVSDGESPSCPNCCMSTNKLPAIFRINMGVGAYGYYDENLGKYIGTNRQRKEEMQKQGVTEKPGKGWY